MYCDEGDRESKLEDALMVEFERSKILYMSNEEGEVC